MAIWLVLFAAESWAAEVDVTAPESVVRRAPFDVAPEVGRVHAGDRLSGNDQASGVWRFVQLPGGAAGYMHDADVKVVLAPVVPEAPAPAGVKLDAPAAAQPPSPAPVSAAAAAPGSGAASSPQASSLPSTQLGVMFEMMPNGSISTSNNVTTDAAFAVAVAPYLDVAPGTSYVSLGFSPQILLGVKGSGGDTQSSTEYDLRARITVRDPVSPQGTVYFRFSPGYSIVSIANLNTGFSNPKGPVFDFSVGTEVSVGSKLVFVFDLGYQVGLQSASDAGVTADFNTRYLHVGVGFALGT
jgi:hypothetical protein